MRLGIVSAKGSPGATTLGLAVAATTRGVMVEADPAGGDVECWAGPRGESGLIRLASTLRHATEPTDTLQEHATEVWPGVRAVLAPNGREQAESTLVALGERLAWALEGVDRWVVVDGGRWARSQPTARRLVGCDVLALTLTPTLAAVAHTRSIVGSLRDTFGVPLVSVIVGERGYPPAEIGGQLGTPVGGVVPWDPRGVQALVTVGASRWWRRSPLARSMRSFVEGLELTVAEAAASG